jgi:hypothetical protein
MRRNRGLYEKLLDERSEEIMNGEGGYPAPDDPGYQDHLQRLRRYAEHGVHNRRQAIDRVQLRSRYPEEHAALMTEQAEAGPSFWSPASPPPVEWEAEG